MMATTQQMNAWTLNRIQIMLTRVGYITVEDGQWLIDRLKDLDPTGPKPAVIEAAAVSRVQTPEPSGWQPIETAPKDGRPVWLIEDGAPLGLTVQHQFAGVWWTDKRYVAGGCWQLVDRDSVGSPTHWMPLAAPPEEPRRPETPSRRIVMVECPRHGMVPDEHRCALFDGAPVETPKEPR